MMKRILMVIMVVAAIFIVGCSNEPSQYDSFAQCLTDKGATMYGTEWCSHCKSQKKAFGDSFQYINYVDCDKSGARCTTAGVTGYPTWSIDGENYPGEQTFGKLASLTGCEI